MKSSKIKLTFATPLRLRNIGMMRVAGWFDFINDLKERSDGEIEAELIPEGRACSESDCIKRCMEGLVDIVGISMQNTFEQAPFFNVLTLPFLFQSRASMLHFLYSQNSQKLFREPLARHYGIRVLATFCAERGLAVLKGSRFDSLEDIEGMRIRTAPNGFCEKFYALLGAEAIRMEWAELEGAARLKMIDAIEAYLYSLADGKLIEYVAAYYEINSNPSAVSIFINEKKLQNMPIKARNIVIESGYYAQMCAQQRHEVAINSVCKAKLEKNGVKLLSPSQKETEKMRSLCSPKNNPKAWRDEITELSRIAGVKNIFEEIYSVVGELPVGTKPENVMPQRWYYV